MVFYSAISVLYRNGNVSISWSCSSSFSEQNTQNFTLVLNNSNEVLIFLLFNKICAQFNH